MVLFSWFNKLLLWLIWLIITTTTACMPMLCDVFCVWLVVGCHFRYCSTVRVCRLFFTFIESIHTTSEDTTWIPYRYVVKNRHKKDCTRKTSTKKRWKKKFPPQGIVNTKHILHMMNKRCFIVGVSFLSKDKIIKLLFFRIAKKNKWKMSRISRAILHYTLYSLFFIALFFIEKHELF